MSGDSRGLSTLVYWVGLRSAVSNSALLSRVGEVPAVGLVAPGRVGVGGRVAVDFW